MAVVKFIRGEKSKYDSTTYADGIYFATDTKEIILNGEIYGYNADEHKEISSVEWDSASDSLVFTYSDGTTSSVSVPIATDEADGLMSAEDKAKLDEIENTNYTGKEAVSVSDGEISLVIDSDEKVLSQSDNGLKSTLGVNYDSDTKMVQLTGIDDEVISQFDATEFIYDGIIKDVSLVTEDPETGKTGEFIKITFYTKPDETGEMGTQDIYLDVTDLTDVYIAGNGITIEAGSDGTYTVSVKVSDSSEGYLTVTEDGVSVNGVDDAISTAVEEEKTRAKEAEAALEEAIEAAKAADATVVTVEGDHLTVTSTVDETTGATTYTIGEDNIASADDLNDLTTFVGSFDDAGSESVCGAINTNSEAISELEEKVSALEATSIDVVGDNDHISVTSATEDSKTTYTVTGSDIASAKFVGSFNDAADAGTVCAAITKNEEAISALETVVETLEAETVTVKAEDEEKHIVVTSNTDENGATIYTLSSSDVASAALVGEFSDTSYKGTVCAAVEGIANSLMWVEVE